MKAGFEGADVGFLEFELFLEFLVEALNGGEGDAIGVDSADSGIAFADVEGGLEILGHGADMAHGVRLGFVIPGSNRKFS